MPDCYGDMVMFVAADNTEVSFDDIRISANDVSRTATNSTTTGGAEVTNYAFDDWGRMDTETRNSVTTKYKWTSANLLKAVDVGNDGSNEVAYTYTGDLKRVWRHESGELTNTYKWDAGFNVVQETYWSGGNATMTKAYAGGLAEVDVTSTPSYSYPTWDHLGSTRGMWDGSIGQLGSWEYTPYGSPYLFAGPSDRAQLFTGHEFDPDTEKYYARFRTLDTTTGRWLSRDPLGMIDGTNEFSYVRNNPIRWPDRMGLSLPKETCDDIKRWLDSERDLGTWETATGLSDVFALGGDRGMGRYDDKGLKTAAGVIDLHYWLDIVAVNYNPISRSAMKVPIIRHINNAATYGAIKIAGIVAEGFDGLGDIPFGDPKERGAVDALDRGFDCFRDLFHP